MSAASQARSPRALSAYVHVPFCSSRCGYCDFNTYTATELGDSVRRDAFHLVLADEIAQTRERMGADARPLQTVFVGGGTPTLLGADGLTHVLHALTDAFGLAPDAEVTTEANPDSVDPAMLAALRAAGYTRISLGMQSASSAVLRVLDRTHTPGASVAMAKAARQVGFEHVNLDLIIGTPGEHDDDVRRSVQDAIDAGVDHVSAYSLIVEHGTPLARRIDRGELAMPDDDIAAGRYEIVDDLLTGAGFDWYEVSNWAQPGGECRHNIAYWNSDDWLGIGPGAHAHTHRDGRGLRTWNAKHPKTYADAIARGESAEAGREEVDAESAYVEEVMLRMRMRTGLPLAVLRADGQAAVPDLVADGLVDTAALDAGTLVLTRRGRLLADAVIRALLG